jgi:hypothetical protein
VSPDLVLDVPLPPAEAIDRLRAGLADRPKRLLGLIKIRSEFIGVLAENSFEIWERRQRAVHAVGQAHGVRGGSRVEVRFRLTPPARVLTIVFFLLYALITIGLATQPPAPDLSALDAAVLAAGAIFFAVLFWVSARRQRRELRDFLTRALSARRTPDQAATSPSAGTRRAGRAR